MNSTLMMILIGGGLLSVLMLGVGIVISMSGERVIEKRIDQYVDEDYGIDVDVPAEKSTGMISDWLNRKVERSSWGEGIARELARADLKVKPGEYLAVLFIAGFCGAVVLYWIAGRTVPIAAVGFAIGLLVPRVMVRRAQTKRLIQFNDQLADMLNLMVNGLRAGYSTMQAMEAVSREMPTPISDEFHRVVQEMQIGISMETSLDNLYRRIPSGDLDLVIAAVNVQREVGGNLAEILDTISYTIRERVRIQGEIRVLTAQVMYSGRFLAMMPLIISGVLWLLNRPYMMEFFNPETRLPGMIMLGIGGMMIMSGYFVMTKIATIEV